MNLEQALYEAPKHMEYMNSLGQKTGQYNKLTATFFDEEKGHNGAKLLNILASYDRGNRDFSDEEVLMVALANKDILKSYKSQFGEIAKGTSWFSKEGRSIRYMKKVVSYADKVARKMMKYLGKNNKPQLAKALALFEEQKSKAEEAYKNAESAIMPYLKK